MKPIRTIPYNPMLDGLAEATPDIVFAHEDGKDITLRIIKPWKNNLNKDRRYPLIVFIQGSGWTFPNINYHLPHISQFAMAGYVVATVTHRSSNDGHPFPAFLQDVKIAIRFLRAHAEEYQIDPERVAAWGTSSGGNTALLVGMTGDDPRFESQEWAGESTSVSAVVDCFGPTDLIKMAEVQYKDRVTEEQKNIFFGLGNGTTMDECRANLEMISPINYVHSGVQFPPFMLLHGDADDVVLYEDTEALYNALCAAGCEAELVRITHAPHEGSFWSPQLLAMIYDFIESKIG